MEVRGQKRSGEAEESNEKEKKIGGAGKKKWLGIFLVEPLSRALPALHHSVV